MKYRFFAKRHVLLLLVIGLTLGDVALYAQQNSTATSPTAPGAAGTAASSARTAVTPAGAAVGGPATVTAVDAPPVAQSAAALPAGFRGIDLGMDIDTVKTKLEADPYFAFRGDPDVSLLPSPNENLIETQGYTYIDRGIFQFYQKKLYTIILMMNQSLLSFYTLYTTFTEKYGEPTSLSPEEVVWQSPDYRLSLERPLSVKYIDMKVFDQLKQEGQMRESQQAQSRDQFLSQF